jgi:hypothetical protein
MRESVIERRLTRAVRKAGGVAYKFVSPGHSGVPDRLIILPSGRVIFVELKTETGKLSKLQLATQALMRKLGADVRTLYGADQVDRFVEEVMSDAFQALSVSTGRRTMDSGA